jgi:hypothetical protein
MSGFGSINKERKYTCKHEINKDERREKGNINKKYREQLIAYFSFDTSRTT